MYVRSKIHAFNSMDPPQWLRTFFSSQWMLSLAGYLLPNCASSQSSFKLCFLLVSCPESSSLFGLWPPSGRLGCCPLGWQPDSPLAFSLRLLASAELCSIGSASPA